MKKTLLAGLVVGAMIFGSAGMACATLMTIGTASYDSNGNGVVESGEIYNLNYDIEDHLTWLDYTKPIASWQEQTDWASGIGSQLTVTLAAGWTGDTGWYTRDWRLPSAGLNPQSGWNQTSSEMGDLYYNELGLHAGYATTAQSNAPGAMYDFNNLTNLTFYWSGTKYSDIPHDDYRWYFSMFQGSQLANHGNWSGYGLAVRPGLVIYSADPIPTPEPATMILMGAGLLGLIGTRRKKK